MNNPSSSLNKRQRIDCIFKWTAKLLTWSSLGILAFLLTHVTITGFEKLSWNFLQNFPSRFPEKAGIKSALHGSVWMLSLVAIVSVPLGVSSAVYLEEYGKKNKLHRIIEVNIANLAGVPSIVYGILGLVIFVRFSHLDRSVLAGSFTMSLLILPVIIISSREAIRAVPNSIRLGAFAVGATKLQTVIHHVLPSALPGILTGVILSMSRAIGETAPLIMIGALTYVAFVPENIMDPFTTLPIQVFNWASRPQEAFHEVAAAGIIVLLFVLLTMNAIAILLRNYTNKKLEF